MELGAGAPSEIETSIMVEASISTLLVAAEAGRGWWGKGHNWLSQ
jgi:hypothetical protein